MITFVAKCFVRMRMSEENGITNPEALVLDWLVSSAKLDVRKVMEEGVQEEGNQFLSFDEFL